MLVKGAPGRCQEVHLSRRRWPEDRFRWCNALVYHSDMGDRWSSTWHQRPRLAARARPSGLIMRRKLSYQARKLSQNNYSSLSCVNLCFFSFQKPQRRVCGVVARRWSFSGHRLQTGMAIADMPVSGNGSSLARHHTIIRCRDDLSQVKHSWTHFNEMIFKSLLKNVACEIAAILSHGRGNEHIKAEWHICTSRSGHHRFR